LNWDRYHGNTDAAAAAAEALAAHDFPSPWWASGLFEDLDGQA
jgi:hypothetical protein